MPLSPRLRLRSDELGGGDFLRSTHARLQQKKRSATKYKLDSHQSLATKYGLPGGFDMLPGGLEADQHLDARLERRIPRAIPIFLVTTTDQPVLEGE